MKQFNNLAMKTKQHFLTFITVFSMLITVSATAQSKYIDTVIHTSVYDSYYSFQLKNPVFVIYKLKNGGGPCDRQKEGFSFKSLKFTAKNTDYVRSGYERGHLANAEDFAYDCTAEKQTFWYYNCSPQTEGLNLGQWKKDETEIREQSQTAEILIICGSYFSNKTIGNGVYVPKFCWKVAQNAKTGEILLCRTYENTEESAWKDVSLAQMTKLTKVKFSSYLKKVKK